MDVVAICVFGLGAPTVACSGNIGGEGQAESPRDKPSNGNDGDGTGRSPQPMVGQEAVAVFSGARRLSAFEYDNVLETLLGDTSRPARDRLPPADSGVAFAFDNGYRNQAVSAVFVQTAESLAFEAAARAMANAKVRERLLPCTPNGADDVQCLTKFVSAFGQRALRRPLAQTEVERFATLIELGKISGDFNKAVEMAIAAFLQHPEFLYRLEIGTPVAENPKAFKLSNFELASRLSFTLQGTMPDDQLFADASAGKLSNADNRRAAALRLLEDARGREQLQRFFAQWLAYQKLPHEAQLSAAMQEETRALIEEVLFKTKGDMRGLFTAKQTRIGKDLATHYGLPQPEGAVDWVDYEDDRRGILSQGSLLSVFGKAKDTSPVLRGLFVATRLLCREIPEPPDDVNNNLPETENACKVDRLQAHMKAGTSCLGCHEQMDPIGFGLENYNFAGKRRAHDDGLPQCAIDGEGQVADLGPFNGPAELATLLVESEEFGACIARQFYRFTFGRHEEAQDEAWLRTFKTQAGTRFRFDDLVLAVVSAPSFALRLQEPESIF